MSKTIFKGPEGEDASLVVIEGDSELGEKVKAALVDIEQYLNTPTTVKVYGKEYEEPRRVAMFGANYTYAKKTKMGLASPPSLVALLNKVNADLGMESNPLNGVLVNKYRKGDDCIGEHSDSEKELIDGDVLSLSVGAARKFVVKRKKTPTNSKRELVCSLHTGPLQYMHMKGKDFQKNYVHGIPREPKVTGVRYSFTFRRHVTQSSSLLK